MKTKILTVLTLLAILTTACSRELERCALTEEQKKVIPYEKGQIISFIDDTGQTVDLTVTESKTEWYKETEGSFRDDYISFEIKTVILKSESNKLNVNLKIFNPCSSNLNYSILDIIIDNDWWFGLGAYSDGIFLTNSANFLLDSIEVNQKVYYNVIEQKHNKEAFDSTGGRIEIPMQLFYNKTSGILQINRDGENFLTISN